MHVGYPVAAGEVESPPLGMLDAVSMESVLSLGLSRAQAWGILRACRFLRSFLSGRAG